MPHPHSSAIALMSSLSLLATSPGCSAGADSEHAPAPSQQDAGGAGGAGGSNAQETGGEAGSSAAGGVGGAAGPGGAAGVGGDGGASNTAGAGGAAGEPNAGGAAGSGGIPNTGGSAASGGTGTGGAGGVSSGTQYAPYFYTWGWGNPAYAFTSLVDLRAKSGPDAVTLAFVLSSGGCAATQDIQQHATDVSAFVASGGHLKASFGGANGTYLENACATSAELQTVLSTFIQETGIDDLDFDVEQWGAMTADVNERRSAALAAVQSQTGAKVAFTLAAVPRDKWGTPGGMTSASLDVIRSAVQSGVAISHVNLMVMDYGGYYSDGQAMGALAISALTEAKAQLQSVMPGLADAQAWAMLGATPMIGQNDVSSEVFTTADAQMLADFVKQNGVGLVAFWAINRDQPGSGDLGLYSGVNQSLFEFHRIFETVK